MQFASLLSSAHAHERETCLGNGWIIILDNQARQQMTMSFQCNVSPITAQKWQLILVQWAMNGQDSMHVHHKHSTNEVEEKWLVHNVMSHFLACLIVQNNHPTINSSMPNNFHACLGNVAYTASLTWLKCFSKWFFFSGTVMCVYACVSVITCSSTYALYV